MLPSQIIHRFEYTQLNTRKPESKYLGGRIIGPFLTVIKIGRLLSIQDLISIFWCVYIETNDGTIVSKIVTLSNPTFPTFLSPFRHFQFINCFFMTFKLVVVY